VDFRRIFEELAQVIPMPLPGFVNYRVFLIPDFPELFKSVPPGRLWNTVS
jgi:hypothetical protein